MADEELSIAVEDLRAALTRQLDATQERFGPSIDLGNADHYWTISADEAFDISKEPEVTVAQLSDDVAEVREFVAGGDEDVFLWHDLAHVIGVLHRIAGLDNP